jgi:peptidoglycan/xylan/chitin deacetylase (PgdA/CDA1 family)
MKDKLLLTIAACLYYSGLLSLSNRLHRHAGGRLLIVNYHRASGGALRGHLSYLRRRFHLQFLDSALAELFEHHQGTPVKQDRRLPLAVTFDDGYEDNFTHAYPLACDLQVPITIFLITGYMDCGTAFWWQDRFICLARVPQVNFNGRSYQLDRQEDQKFLAQAIDAQFHFITTPEARYEFLLSLSKMLSLPPPVIPAITEEPVPMLTWEQIYEMQASKWVRFGGHTVHHPTLSLLQEAEEAACEVTDCHTQLQERLAQQVDVFAYPHGGIEHIGAGGIQAVEQADFRWAVTTVPGVNTHRTHPYLIRRMAADSQMHWLIIALRTSGIWDCLSYFNWLIKKHRYRKILHQMNLKERALLGQGENL